MGITASRTGVKASDAAEGSCHNIDIGVSARHLLKDQDTAMTDDLDSEIATMVCLDLSNEGKLASTLTDTITHDP